MKKKKLDKIKALSFSLLMKIFKHKLKSVMQAPNITLLGLRPRVGVKLLGLWPRVKPNFCGFWDQNLNLYVPTFCILEFAARSE